METHKKRCASCFVQDQAKKTTTKVEIWKQFLLLYDNFPSGVDVPFLEFIHPTTFITEMHSIGLFESLRSVRFKTSPFLLSHLAQRLQGDEAG